MAETRCDMHTLIGDIPMIGDLRLFQLEHLPATQHGTWERDVIYRGVSK